MNDKDRQKMTRLRSIPVSGTSAGAGGRIEETTAPNDNLAAFLRDGAIIVGSAMHPIGEHHLLESPVPLSTLYVEEEEKAPRGELRDDTVRDDTE